MKFWEKMTYLLPLCPGSSYPEQSAPEGQYWPEQPLKPTPHSANKNFHAKPGKTDGIARGYTWFQLTMQQTQSLQSTSS